jgi:hypothetical protein
MKEVLREGLEVVNCLQELKECESVYHGTATTSKQGSLIPHNSKHNPKLS